MSGQNHTNLVHVAFMDYSAQILISDTIRESKYHDFHDSDSSHSNRPNLRCSICGKEFENVGDMQRHTTVEHMQKGELPSKSKEM
jgi:stress-induced morphogen